MHRTTRLSEQARDGGHQESRCEGGNNTAGRVKRRTMSGPIRKEKNRKHQIQNT